jgi:hypothetical protein
MAGPAFGSFLDNSLFFLSFTSLNFRFLIVGQSSDCDLEASWTASTEAVSFTSFLDNPLDAHSLNEHLELPQPWASIT